MRKHIEEIAGTIIGGVTGFITQPLYDDWIKPIILTIICSLIGLFISHYGKKILNSWEYNKKLPRFKKNGKP